MLKFKKPKITLEIHNKKGTGKNEKIKKPLIPDDICTSCPDCKKTILRDDVRKNVQVCNNCNYHFLMKPKQRVELILDEGSFEEINSELQGKNPIDFPDYEEKIKNIQKISEATESVVTGTGKIENRECAIFVMDAHFMMGSMGVATGEKITRLFEYATEKNLPVIGYTASGGARMQEGIFSLMQMAKTSGAVKKHSEKGNLYVTVLTNPTTGGVTASFAMEGDIILSEPKALIGFAGPRVIEQTIREKLPKGFQRAEMLLEKGFIDAIVERKDQRKYLGKILMLHSK